LTCRPFLYIYRKNSTKSWECLVDYLKIAQAVLNQEAQALLAASEKLSAPQLRQFTKIVEMLKQFGGNLIFSGVGKSGVVASKISSTFSSLGLPSFFLHPTDALHGDLGRVTTADAIVFISNSGTTEEILKMIPYLPIEKNMKIAMVGNCDSPIAKLAGLVFDCSVKSEACINNQAPTTSTTLAMAMGDALAVAYESFVKLSVEGFAKNHPGGLLGKSLRLRVFDLMVAPSQCPQLKRGSTLQDVILAMTKYPIGGCVILDEGNVVLGIMVEGDIRRTFTKDNFGLKSPVEELMNKNPITISPEALAIDALEMMENRGRSINILPVVDENHKFLGIIKLHDLLKEGFIKRGIY